MRLTTAIKRLQSNYEKAKNQPWIVKPITWALFQTYKWADSYEKPREEKNKFKQFKGERKET